MTETVFFLRQIQKISMISLCSVLHIQNFYGQSKKSLNSYFKKLLIKYLIKFLSFYFVLMVLKERNLALIYKAYYISI